MISTLSRRCFASEMCGFGKVTDSGFDQKNVDTD